MRACLSLNRLISRAVIVEIIGNVAPRVVAKGLATALADSRGWTTACPRPRALAIVIVIAEAQTFPCNSFLASCFSASRLTSFGPLQDLGIGTWVSEARRLGCGHWCVEGWGLATGWVREREGGGRAVELQAAEGDCRGKGV